jgi:hypothetical protein
MMPGAVKNNSAQSGDGEAVIITLAPESSRTELASSGHSWIERAQACEITDQVTYDQVVDLLQSIAEAKDRVTARYRESKSLANQTHLKICQDERDLLDPLEVSEEIFKQKIADYDDRQKELRAEICKNNRRSLQSALNLPLNPSGAGETSTAISLPRVVPPAPEPYVRREEISRARTKHKAEVYNIRLLCAAVAEGRISPMYVEGAMALLDDLADAEGTAMNVPGVRAVKDNHHNIRVRRRS